MHAESASSAPVATYADRPITKVPDWHGLVVLDVLLNNLATGLFLGAAIGDLLAPASFGPTARMAYPVALVLLVADLICLVLDLGDPGRFHHMLRVWKPSSPMNLGTWSLTAFSVPLTWLAATSLFPALPGSSGWLRTVILVVGLVPAVGSAVYKGVLFNTTSQPGWREARWLGGYLVNSALLLGAAMLLGLATILQQSPAASPLRVALLGLLPLNLGALGLLLWDVGTRLSEVRNRMQLAVIGALSVFGGIVLPEILFAWGSETAHLTAVVLVLGGALVIRAELVYLPHRLRVPAREVR